MRTALLTGFIFTFCSAAAVAQSRPDFSGTWKLNVTSSDFGPLPPSNSRTDKIVQTDAAIKDTVDDDGAQGQQQYTLTYTTDGKETVNSLGPFEMKTTAKWDGPAFNTASKLTIQDQDVEIKGIWTLSSDGKTLTESIHFTSGMGDGDQKLVFEKQTGGPAAATVTPATAIPGALGAKPNYTGTWKLDKVKSDFGPLPAPDEQTYIIDHKEPKVKLTISQEGPQGKSESTVDTTTDGREAATKFFGQPAIVITGWEGKNLASTVKGSVQGMDFNVKTVYMLSEDGRTLTVSAHITSGMGDADQKILLNKM